MPTPIPITRLPGLKTALEGYAEGEMAAQKTLADLYGVATSRFSTLVKNRFEDFPPAERRGDKTHWYDARRAIQSMIAYMEGSSSTKVAAAARATAVMTGVTAAQDAAVQQAADTPPPMTSSEIDRLASAQTRMWKLAKDQGLYVLAADVRANARRVNSLFVRSLTSVRVRIDPNGQLPPEMSDRIDKILRQMVAEVHDEMAKMMGADDVEMIGADDRTADAPRRGSRTI